METLIHDFQQVLLACNRHGFQDMFLLLPAAVQRHVTISY